MIRQSLLVTIVILVFMASPSVAQKRSTTGQGESLDPATAGKNIYPENADAAKEIDDALKTIAKTKKRVLLIFGGNWCYDCHVLDQALHRGRANEIVQANYVIVHVDIGEGAKNAELVKKYRIPLEKGVPAVAVLGSDGALIYSSGDGQFESARTMLKTDLIAFLMIWKAPDESPTPRPTRSKN